MDAEISISAFRGVGQRFISPSHKSDNPFEVNSVCLQDAMRSPSLETSQDIEESLQPSCCEHPWRFCGVQKVCERWTSVIKVQEVLQLKLEFYSQLRKAGFSSCKEEYVKAQHGCWSVCLKSTLISVGEKLTDM